VSAQELLISVRQYFSAPSIRASVIHIPDTGDPMRKWNRLGVAAVVVAACLAGVNRANAAPLILNGGFEAGFASWTRADQLGGDGTFSVQSGTASPLNGDPVPAPPEGLNAAMTDAGAPGSHALYQDFVVNTTSGLLTFDLFIANRGDRFENPAVGLDFSTPAINQQVRIDIMLSTADPFSVAPSDVLLNLYQSQPGDALVAGYTPMSFDISALLAANLSKTLRFRVAEVDNLAPLQVGLDNVALNAVPEPASLLLMGAGVAALLVRRRSA